MANMIMMLCLVCVCSAVFQAALGSPYYIGNDIQPRSNILINPGSNYMVYIHKEYLPLGDLREFQLYLHQLQSKERCIRLQVWQNEPLSSPQYHLRWEKIECFTDGDQEASISVRPGVPINDTNYVFGWTISPDADECPITMDVNGNNLATNYNEVPQEPVVGGAMYIQIPTEHTFSIGVVVYNDTDIQTTESIQTTEAATESIETTEAAREDPDDSSVCGWCIGLGVLATLSGGAIFAFVGFVIYKKKTVLEVVPE